MEFQRGFAPAIRTSALLQIGLALSQDRSDPARPYQDIRLALGSWEEAAYRPALSFATGGVDVAFAVGRGEVDLGTINPSAYLTMAYRGTGPFPEPLAVRAIGVIPSWDRMAFAVAKRTGLTSISQIRERRYPLRVSVRSDPANSTRFVVDEVLGAVGLSLRDVEAWGGSLQEVNTPSHPSRLEGIREATIDAVFDEGITGWGNVALENGMRFLTLEEPARQRMEELGWPVGPIPASRFPGVREPVLAASFSGWPLFTRASLPDEVAYRICQALEAVQSQVDWGRDPPTGMEHFRANSDDAPLGVPLHPGAERFYAERGG